MRRLFATLCLALLLACSAKTTTPTLADAGPSDATPNAASDGAPHDAGVDRDGPATPVDASNTDGGALEAGVADSGPGDGGRGDAESAEVGHRDAAAPDATRPALVAVPPPPPPTFGATIGTLSVVLRTADVEFAGTDAPQELCLNGRTCFNLDVPDVNDRARGGTDVYHFEGVGLARSDVRQVTLRTTSDPATNNDRWEPACLELRFDGEPVFCNDALSALIGTGSSNGETVSWRDPVGLRQVCDTCQRGRLTHGPMIGASSSDTVRVWARTDATRQVGLRMSITPDMTGAPIVAWTQPRPEDDFATHLAVSGLAPGQRYYYRVEVAGDTSQPVRPIRTAPAPSSVEDVRLAFGSCAKDATQPIFQHIAAAAPDLFLHVGDNHYANSRNLRAHRWYYRRNKAMRWRDAVNATVPTIATWDDHDFLANNSNGTCRGRATARRAFGEYWANPSMGAGGMGVYFTQRHGPLELFVLDCRTFRPDVADPQNNCDPHPNPPSLPLADGPLGRAQTAWLLDGLSASDAPFKFLACGSRFTPEGSRDSWAEFDVARTALFDALHTRGIEGVALLSGDIHTSELRTIERARGYPLPELVSSPLARDPGACTASDANLRRACLAERSFITVDVQVDRPDPRLVVRIVNSTGGEHRRWVIPRSALR